MGKILVDKVSLISVLTVIYRALKKMNKASCSDMVKPYTYDAIL